jgi:hypothetical protein
MNVSVADRVEGHVNAPRLLGHGGGVLVDGLLIESIDFRRLGRSTCGGDFRGHPVEHRESTAGKEDFRPLAGEGAGHGPTDYAAPSIDHGVLVLEQHAHPPICRSDSRSPGLIWWRRHPLEGRL